MSTANGAPKTTATMTLRMELLSHTVTIDADLPSLECGIAMLQQALRALEQQERIKAAIALQQKTQDEAENRRVAQMIRKG